MDYAACNVVYVDRTAGESKLVKRPQIRELDGIVGDKSGQQPAKQEIVGSDDGYSRVHGDLKTLLGSFSEVYVCSSGKACILKLSELHESSTLDLIPTLVLINIPYNDSLEDSQAGRTPSPTSSRQLGATIGESEAEDKFYGLSLLQWINSDIQQGNLSKLVVPVAVVAVPEGGQWPLTSSQGPAHPPLDQKRTMRYLDVGAVDVLTTPLIMERLPSLAIHAYRAHKESLKDQKALMDLKRGRKRSWVGLDDAKPYAYLREAMVSGLMDGICRLGGDNEEVPLTHTRVSVTEERKDKIVQGVRSWAFSAHDFSDDELLLAAVMMLQHALSMSELEQYRMPAGTLPTRRFQYADRQAENLTGFLMACRAAYNSFVPYHNFRHVIDVLQACFHFLVRNGTLPPYPIGSSDIIPQNAKSPIAALLRPFDALTLLVTAIGHDVGHPGVNNAFLVTLNAPLAQLYNDRSVLESFHCAAYSQILRRHWPAAFAGVEMRQLMISSILATDMGLHFDYMKKLGFLEEKLHENKGTDGFNGRLREEYRTLACSLLIKCADISNVARRYDIAEKWTMILTDEFARQASMERDLAIPSALFAPPVREIVELGQSQIGFMNMFAIPLFQGVTDVLPAMKFCVEELQRNRKVWEDRIEVEQQKKRKDSEDSVTKDGTFSPRQLIMVAGGAKEGRGGTPADGNSPSSSTDHLGTHNNNKHNSKSPLSTPDSTYSKFRALTDLPKTDQVERTGHLSSETLMPPQYSLGRQASKPAPGNLQLPFTTASAPGLLDHPAQLEQRGIHVESSTLVTDAVVSPPSEKAYSKSTDSMHEVPNSKFTSATDGTRAEPPEWARSGSGSQATSATTGKLPLSPSTQGTSVMSDEIDPDVQSDDYGSSNTVTSASKSERPQTGAVASSKDTSAQVSSAGTSDRGSKSLPDISTGAGNVDRGRVLHKDNENEKPSGGLMDSMRSLAKKPSRSRFRFWKKKGSFNSIESTSKDKEETPPLPRAGEASR